MPIVYSTCQTTIPSGTPLTAKEGGRLASLQRRAHLAWPDEARRLEPLTEDEREEMLALEQKQSDERTPTWGPLRFPFGPAGKAGSAWDLRENMASAIVSQHPKWLHILGENEAVPGDVRPMRPKQEPTAEDLTPYSKWKEAAEMGPVFKDGVGWVKTGAMIPTQSVPKE